MNSDLAIKLRQRIINSRVLEVAQELERTRALKNTDSDRHLQELARLKELLIEREKTLGLAQADVLQLQLRLRLLEEQRSEQALITESRLVEAQESGSRWDRVEQRMESITTEILDAKTVIRQAVTTPQGQITNSKVVEELKSQNQALSMEIEGLLLCKSTMEEAAETLMDRYKDGKLVRWFIMSFTCR